MNTRPSDRQQEYIAVIDLGKTNAKVAVVDVTLLTEVEVLTQATPSLDSDMYASLDTDAIWQFILNSLNRICLHFRIKAITVTTHGATAAVVDASGELVLPVLDYESTAPDQTLQEYSTLRPPFSETGSPQLAGGLNIGAQLYWQSRTFPDQFKRAHFILMYPQYWVHRLSGVFASDVTSLGCHTDLINPITLKMSSLVHSQNWVELIPPVSQSGTHIGTITKAVAEATSLAPETIVMTGIHDSNASLIPYLKQQSAPYSVVSTGTWVVSMSISTESTVLDPDRDTLMNINAEKTAVPTALFMGGREYEMLKPANSSVCEFPESNDTISSEAIEVIKSVINSEAMLLPSVKNDCGPFPGREARWTVTEQDLTAPERDVVIAFYLALMTTECLSLIEAKGPTYVEGPFASNAVLLVMLSASTNRDLFARQTLTGTSIGAAMLYLSSKSSSQPSLNSAKISVPQELRNDLFHYAQRWKDLAYCIL